MGLLQKKACNNAGFFLIYGARGRNRTGTPMKAQDFKSCVSTNFTTRAMNKYRYIKRGNYILSVGKIPFFWSMLWVLDLLQLFYWYF